MKAVVFDLFETLITEWGRYKYTTREIAGDLGVDYGPFREEWEKLHAARYVGELATTEAVLNHILCRIGERPRPELTRVIGEKKERNKEECFASVEPGILALLDALRARGCRIGLISNCSPEEVRALPRCALYAYFAEGAAILSCDVGLKKPDRAIYELCLRRLGVDAADCLFVGDGGSDELAGAAAAGLTPVKAAWFTERFRSEPGGDGRFPTAHEPLDILKQI